MRRLILSLGVLGIGALALAQDGPLTNGANILVRTDGNGYVLAAAQTYTGPDGPMRTFANTLVRTDANGYLIITNPTGFGGGAPDDAQYWVGAANADLTAEKNLGALSTGLVLNTSGTPSAYGGTSCTNQFPRSLNASGAATCASVSLTADVIGTLPASNLYTEFTTTSTGNIDNLDFSNANIIRMNNASDATIRGLLAGTPGQRVTIASVGAGHVYLAHQNLNSTVENRLINTATSGNTPLSAGAGAATYQYDGTTDRWRLIGHEQGQWIGITYAAGNFTATSGNWTVDSADQVTYQYFLTGRSLTVTFTFNDTDVSSTPSTLLAAGLPFTINKTSRATMIYQDAGGGNTNGMASTLATETRLQLTKFSGTWSATSSDNTAIFGTVIIDAQ